MKRFSLTLTIEHPSLADPITHVDMMDADSKTALFRMLSIPSKHAYDLRTIGEARWTDQHGGDHHLVLEEITARKTSEPSH